MNHVLKSLSRRDYFSTLLGQSWFSRITVLTPFVGYFLIFNADVQPYIEVVFPEPSHSGTAIAAVIKDRLVFLYLGLFLFGSGIGLYQILSPAIIRTHSTASAYISYMEDIKTQNLTRRSLDSTVAKFFSVFKGEELSGYFAANSTSFPSDVVGSLHSLIERCFHNDEDLARQFSEPAETGTQNFYPGTMGLDTGAVLEEMYSGRSVTRALYEVMHQQAYLLSKEVFFLEYRVAEHSRPAARIIVAVFILSGLTLMLIPSIATAYLAALELSDV